jgi:hypothetical protein
MIDTNEPVVVDAEVLPASVHHPFSPSRLQMLKECPGAARMQYGLEEVRTPEAEEGTMLHERIVTRDLGGLNTEQESLVCKCIEFLESKKTEDLKECLQEVRLTIRDGENVLTYGTADVVLLYEDFARVIDWKFGRNPVTDANRNLQLAAYALGVMQKYGVSSVEVIVYQPRIYAVTAYTFTKPDNIRKNIARVIEAAKNTEYLILHAGEACRYCLAKAKCPAFRDHFEALTVSQSPALDNPDVLLEYFEKSRQAERFIKEIDEAFKRYIEENGSLGGWRFKEKPGNREIKDVSGLYQRIAYLVTPGELSAACKLSVTGVLDIMVEKYLTIAKAEGIKLTKTDAKKKAEQELGDLIQRGKPTRTLVKE